MSNKHDFLRSDNTKSQLFADTLSLMTKGAGYALGLCVILGVTYAVLIGVSAILPPESKEQPDPNPVFSQLLTEPEPARLI
jgi:hypothetical protein